MVVKANIDMGYDPGRVVVVGDIHHCGHWATVILDRAAATGIDTIVQVGDLGFWPHRGGTFLQDLADTVEELGLRFYWIEGNHEDLDALEPGEKTCGQLQHLPRGFRWQWWGKTWMAVGGGVSVDKHHRTPGWDWFPQETLSLAEAQDCARPGGVDIVLSHDCPDRVDIPGLAEHAGWYPDDAIAESEDHRAVLGQICDAVSPSLLVHGHYHIAHETRRDDSPTLVRGLDRDGTHWESSTMVLTADSLAGIDRRQHA
jgi:hypothetical protein